MMSYILVIQELEVSRVKNLGVAGSLNGDKLEDSTHFMKINFLEQPGFSEWN